MAETLVAARDERLRALAARERYRVRALRLERRAAERAAKRAPASTVSGGPATVADNRPPLPSAAAAVLARAKARAAERGKP